MERVEGGINLASWEAGPNRIKPDGPAVVEVLEANMGLTSMGLEEWPRIVALDRLCLLAEEEVPNPKFTLQVQQPMEHNPTPQHPQARRTARRESLFDPKFSFFILNLVLLLHMQADIDPLPSEEEAPKGLQLRSAEHPPWQRCCF